MISLWFVAGEASGDARAAELMNALKAIDPDLRFLGAGGPRMRELASEPFDDWIAQAGVLGLWDVLKHYGYFRRKFHRMLGQIAQTNPQGDRSWSIIPDLICVWPKHCEHAHFPGKILFYISPQVWAWNRE